MKKIILLLSFICFPSWAQSLGNTFSKDLSSPVRTDTNASIVYPYIKLMFGADGTETPISNLNPLPVSGGAPTPTMLTIYQAAITIGTSAVRLTHNGSAPPSTRVLLAAQLSSSSSATCYFGSSSVTTTGSTVGVQMAAGQIFSFSNDAGDYWAICGTASQSFLVVEQE